MKIVPYLRKVLRVLKNRFIRNVKYSNSLYFFSKGRVITKEYQKGIPSIGANGYKAANYWLDSRIPLSEKSIVYSLGILTDISFDLFIQHTYGCKIFMYDPTPQSVEYMKKYEYNPALVYRPYGVWTENTRLKFFKPETGGSSSAVLQQGGSEYFEAQCFTMETLMQQNNHKHISVFKADIEGAALPVLQQMVEKSILPDQIVAEFERPKGDMVHIKAFFEDLSNLRERLREAGYSEYILPREKAKYLSIEMLFVNKHTMKQR